MTQAWWKVRLIPASRARWVIYPLLIIGLGWYFTPAFLYAGPTNGFDLSNSLVPIAEIHHGGPPRDGIPAINKPVFVEADAADFLHDEDSVLGINRNGVRKAYPVRILDHHEIVNDRFDRESVVVSYCPLCGTGMAFVASVDGTVHRFGVSGLLYNNDVLLYDRSTDSLWSQLMRQAVSGPLRDSRLQQVAMSHTSWGDWRRRHPDTRVLSTDTGSRRDYRRSPYTGYVRSKALYFPMRNAVDPRYHPKERVIGLTLDGASKVYPFSELSRTDGELRDRFAGRELRIRFNAENRSGDVFNAAGEELPSTTGYWFAWLAFHPNSEVYTAP